MLEWSSQRLAALERVAEAALEELRVELDRTLAAIPERDRAEVDELRSIGEVLSRHSRTVAEWSGAIGGRVRAETAGRTAAGPSEGVVLVVQQLALAGASEQKMIRVLAELGVEDPQAAIDRALRPLAIGSG